LWLHMASRHILWKKVIPHLSSTCCNVSCVKDKVQWLLHGSSWKLVFLSSNFLKEFFQHITVLLSTIQTFVNIPHCFILSC
jgi:hypothetical protein